MPISRKYKIIFFHIPRCAGTSIINTLDMYYCRHYKWKHHCREFRSVWDDFTKFAIVRNPYTRIVSIYNYIQLDESYWHSVTGKALDGKHKDYDFCNNHSFEETIEELYDNFLDDNLSGDEWEKQHTFIYNDDKLMIDKILRFENLPNNFNNLMKKCNVNVTLPRLNSSDTSNYMNFYNNKTKQMVREIYEKDFELLGYE